MPKYVIERKVPGVGKLNQRDRKAAAMKSVKALKDIGPDIQWIHSYVSENKTHCVYLAKNKKLIKEHAERSGFPANKITKVDYIMEPLTAE
jgi:hypothetical protein